MQQPQGFIDRRYPHYVCKLIKSLYGIKQAPRAWFECFTSYLLTLGFSASTAESYLFVLKKGSDIVYLLLYVDDIIVTGTITSIITELISKLQCRFDMTDLGALKYFLGLEITRDMDGIHVSQAKYVRDVLTRFGMLSAKPCSTPIALRSDTDIGSLCSVPDAQNYRALVGALHYLTFSSPEIAFSVSRLSQFMHSPHERHLVAAKRVLR